MSDNTIILLDNFSSFVIGTNSIYDFKYIQYPPYIADRASISSGNSGTYITSNLSKPPNPTILDYLV